MIVCNADAVEAKRQRKQAVDAELGELHTRCHSVANAVYCVNLGAPLVCVLAEAGCTQQLDHNVMAGHPVYFRRAALEAQLGAVAPAPGTSPSPATSPSGSPTPDDAAAQGTSAAAAQRANEMGALLVASQHLQQVKQRQYILHQELDQLKADVSPLLGCGRCNCLCWRCTVLS